MKARISGARHLVCSKHGPCMLYLSDGTEYEMIGGELLVEGILKGSIVSNLVGEIEVIDRKS